MGKCLIFGGRSSREFDLLIQHPPEQVIPARRITTTQVQGRSGNLHLDDGAFENYIQSYEVGFKGDVPGNVHAIANWLCAVGQQRLEDEYDPNHFRLATFVGPAQWENKLGKIGKCRLEFDCDPRSYLKAGEIPVEMSNAGQLYNPTAFAAKPIITVYGCEAAVLILGETMIHIKVPIDLLYLDCDTMNAYTLDENGDQVNKNSIVEADYFPELKPGINVITWTGNLARLELIPRWWEL